MRSIGKKLSSVGAVAVALVVLTACSGSGEEDGKDRNDDPVGWSTCNTLFGAERVDALQEAMGQGTLRTLNASESLDELTSSWVRLAESWEPGRDLHFASNPCTLGTDGTGNRFRSDVSWSFGSLADIKAQGIWETAGKDVYVLRRDSGLHITAVFPCKIKGSHQAQEAQFPLEVETAVANVPGFDTGFLGELTVRLARTVAKKLPCTNDPKIPDAL